MNANQSQIEALRRELQETSHQATELWSKHSPEQLLRRPSERKWSAAECLEHLNITNRAYVARIEEALRELEAKNVACSVPMGVNLNAKLLGWWLEPPSRLKLPTAPAFQPLAVTPTEEVLRAFQELNARIERQLNRGRGLGLDKAMIGSPFAKA